MPRFRFASQSSVIEYGNWPSYWKFEKSLPRTRRKLCEVIANAAYDMKHATKPTKKGVSKEVTPEQAEAGDKLAQEIHDKIMTRLGYEDEHTIAEAVAIRVIDALEWAAPSHDIACLAAEKLAEDYELPRGAAGYIKKHFDLAY